MSRRLTAVLIALALLQVSATASAHVASNSFLTINITGTNPSAAQMRMAGQIELAVRDAELADFHAQIERDQGQQPGPGGQPHLGQHGGEPETMQEPEREGDPPAVFGDPGNEVVQRRDHDRGRDDRFREPAGQVDHVQGGQ